MSLDARSEGQPWPLPLGSEVRENEGVGWVVCWPPLLAQRARSEGARLG